MPRLSLLLSTCIGLLCVAQLGAQPDPRQMSGLPLPDPALPDGTITVRVIRGQIATSQTILLNCGKEMS